MLVAIAAGYAAESPSDGGMVLPREKDGAAELRWIDEHDPESGDQERRREALEAAITMFPEDAGTVFRARVRLAIVAWSSGFPARAHEQLQQLLAEPGVADRDITAWAETVDAQILAHLGRIDDSRQLLSRLFQDTRLQPARRSLAAAAAADLELPRSPDRALAILKWAEAIPGGATAEIQAGEAHVFLFTGHDEEVRDLLRLEGDSSSEERWLVAVMGAAADWHLPGDGPRLSRLADFVGEVVSAPSQGVMDAMARCRLAGACQSIREQLARLNARGPMADWLRAAPLGRPLSVEALRRAVDQAVAQGEPERCLRLSLRELAADTHNGDLPQTLWQTAGYADWAERMGKAGLDLRICDQLLGLCDLLPVGQKFWIEGKFLRAQRCRRMEDRVGEQAALDQIIAVPALRPAYLTVACMRLGTSLESTGRFEKALEVDTLAEAFAAEFPAGADCTFHAILMHLGVGDDFDAVRLLGILANAPARVINGSSAPVQIREVVGLAQSDRGREAWVASRKWWLIWEAYKKDLIRGADARETVPVIVDLPGLLGEARRAADAGDERGYFRAYGILLSAARWQPSLAPEVAAISAPALRFVPTRSDQLRSLLVEILRAPHPPDLPNEAERQLYLAANYLNLHLAADALEVAKAFNDSGRKAESLAPAMHQIRGLASLDAGRDFGLALPDLESDLANPRATEPRAMTVAVVAALYHRMGRDPDALTLLKREIDNPTIASDRVGRADLVARLAQLSGQAPATVPAPSGSTHAAHPGSSPTDAAADWIRAQGFSWYGYTEPFTLSDPSFPDLATLLADPGRSFPPAGQLKFLLLASQDQRLSSDQRQGALVEACTRLLESAPTYGQMESIARAAIDHPAFGEEGRLRILWTMLAALSADGRKEDYAAWRRDPLCARFSPSRQKDLARLDREAALDRQTPDAVAALARTLAAESMDWPTVQTMTDLFGDLLRLGDIEEAAALAAGLPGWKVEATAEGRLDAVQLDYARQLRWARRVLPVEEAMVSSLLGAYPRSARSLPEDYADVRLSGAVPAHLPAATFQACIHLAATRQFDRGDLAFWGTVFGALPRDSEAPSAVAQLLHAGLLAAPDDALRSELIVRFFSNADIDDPLIRQAAEVEFARYRRPTDFPQSYLVIRLYEIHRDLRLGVPVDFQTDYADLGDSRAGVVRARDAVRYYLQTADLARLRRTLEGIDGATLLSPGFLPQSIPAFAALGMTDELHSARNAAQRALKSTLADSWVFGSDSSTAMALDLALAMADPEALPPAWVAELGSDPSNPLRAGRVRLVNFYLHADWAGVEREAASLNESYPNRYSFYGFRGFALHNLGRDDEAREALAVYVRHARDEVDYPRAVALLRSIAAQRGHLGAILSPIMGKDAPALGGS
jgi:hypothetical protein